jgi:aconitase B
MNSCRFDYSPDIATCLVVATCRQTVDGLLAPPSTAWQRMESPAHAETAMQIQTQEHIQQKGESRNMLCHSQAMQINGTGFPSSSAIDLYFGGPF